MISSHTNMQHMSTESIGTAEDGSTITKSLGDNYYFGTEILEKGGSKQYSSTVTATNKVTCWILQKTDIKRVLGSSK